MLKGGLPCTCVAAVGQSTGGRILQQASSTQTSTARAPNNARASTNLQVINQWPFGLPSGIGRANAVAGKIANATVTAATQNSAGLVRAIGEALAIGRQGARALPGRSRGGVAWRGVAMA
jgi:hypothetical protein